MKKIILLPVFAFTVIFTACGPAAEDREQMHIRAKAFQDSIANIIKVSMAEAAAPGPNVPPPAAPAATATAVNGQPANPNAGANSPVTPSAPQKAK